MGRGNVFERGVALMANSVPVDFPSVAYQNMVNDGRIDAVVNETILDGRDAWVKYDTRTKF